MDLSTPILGLNFEQLSAVVFVVCLGIILAINHKKVALQKVLFPVIYIIMYRTKVGINLMNKISEKYREQVKLFGYCAIGMGFFGMIYISSALLHMFFKQIFKPHIEEPGLSLVLPFTNVPGIGYLSFWHWIIAIFILAVIHEFGHGVVARAHGLEVKSSGFAVFSIFIPILPAAFVEPDEEKLKKEKDIVQYSIFAAGPTVNILFAILLVVLFPFAADMTGSSPAPFEESITEPIGLSFNLINESLPAGAAGLKSEMVISAINGKPIKDYTDFSIELVRHAPGDEITVTADGNDYVVKTIENPSNPKLAFLGISPLNNEKRVLAGYETHAKILFWIKGLIRWLFLLNLFIGLANLLPLGIVDGGRMLDVALGKIVKSKENSRRIWGTISIVFLIILIFGLITTYVGNPFKFIP